MSSIEANAAPINDVVNAFNFTCQLMDALVWIYVWGPVIRIMLAVMLVYRFSELKVAVAERTPSLAAPPTHLNFDSLLGACVGEAGVRCAFVCLLRIKHSTQWYNTAPSRCHRSHSDNIDQCQCICAHFDGRAPSSETNRQIISLKTVEHKTLVLSCDLYRFLYI